MKCMDAEVYRGYEHYVLEAAFRALELMEQRLKYEEDMRESI